MYWTTIGSIVISCTLKFLPTASSKSLQMCDFVNKNRQWALARTDMPGKQRPLNCPNTTADKTAAKTTDREGNKTHCLAHRMLLDTCDSRRQMEKEIKQHALRGQMEYSKPESRRSLQGQVNIYLLREKKEQILGKFYFKT